MLKRSIGATLCALGFLALPEAGSASVWARSSLPSEGSRPATAGGDAIAGSSALRESAASGRVEIVAEGIAPADVEAIARATELRWNAIEARGWSLPFTSGSPLAVRLESVPGPTTSALATDASAATLAMNINGQTVDDVAEEIVRQAADAMLASLAPGAGPVVTGAAAQALAISAGPGTGSADRDALMLAEAAPQGSFDSSAGEIVAALWLRSLSDAAAPGFLRRAWLDRIARGEEGFSAIAQAFEEETGASAQDAFVQALEEAYASTTPEGELARVAGTDLSAGVLDAASPGPWNWRFYSFSPEAGGAEAVAWPEDGSAAFAVVRYEDGLPADLVRLTPGSRPVLPLSGVTRIDFVVCGDQSSPASALRAPARVSHQIELPFSGLSAHASSAPGEGVRLEWTTQTQHGLLGWVIFRSEAREDGSVAASSPEWIPAQRDDDAGSGFAFVDPSAGAGRYYRYDVWAITSAGTLSKAFRATLQAQ